MDAPSTLYAGSCNPSRRAKRLRTVSPGAAPSSSECRPSSVPSLPKLRPREQEPEGSGAASVAVNAGTSGMPDSPSSPKVIRKPTSRAQREAQRKLNHSIIEKVRRTKINDALAVLRGIVPVDYGKRREIGGGAVEVEGEGEGDTKEENGEENEGESGGEEEGGKGGCVVGGSGEPRQDPRTRKRRAKVPSGKKEEKEKEYKLEILVRTVSFVQDLLEKVRSMEEVGAKDPEVAECKYCGRDPRTGDGVVSGPRMDRKRKREPQREEEVEDSDDTPESHVPSTRSRLPSISSWLPLPHLDPSHLTAYTSPNYTKYHHHHLPSPPSSTLVDPIKPTQLPPAFSLDRHHRHTPNLNMTTIARSISTPTSPIWTPDDESAASLLLQIRHSPPSPSYAVKSASALKGFGSAPSMRLPEVAVKYGASGGDVARSSSSATQDNGVPVHTPSSLLGLKLVHRERES